LALAAGRRLSLLRLGKAQFRLHAPLRGNEFLPFAAHAVQLCIQRRNAAL